MPTTAGQMSQTPPGDPQWRACDGSIVYGYQAPMPPQTARPHAASYSYGTYRDWVLRMGFNRTKGIGGWRIVLPKGAGWFAATADDSGETALVPNVTTTTTASVASGLTVIPVTSATGFVVGLPIAATGIPAGASIAGIAGLNITINPATTGTVASGATVTVTPAGPPTAQKPPAGVV
jgi:hypothetical protein